MHGPVWNTDYTSGLILFPNALTAKTFAQFSLFFFTQFCPSQAGWSPFPISKGTVFLSYKSTVFIWSCLHGLHSKVQFLFLSSQLLLAAQSFHYSLLFLHILTVFISYSLTFLNSVTCLHQTQFTKHIVLLFCCCFFSPMCFSFTTSDPQHGFCLFISFYPVSSSSSPLEHLILEHLGLMITENLNEARTQGSSSQLSNECSSSLTLTTAGLLGWLYVFIYICIEV